ncbi:alkaline serine protease [Priestia megaterium]|uniref:S8 family peptidase n=1 Tax=Priestia megaterium TaxID=1404 RepID=UPI000BF7B678|nr:S8 family peptidase [Priestia megaterium]RFB21192.1 peptidase S8 [Bacillus sp. ALD]PFI61514.1 alkaline serine protease [Priestia megaterium]PGK57791.1 alkaline serine protease [Priestia megaterium]PGR29525.1 alkaline serine protease [Priestia megaterium]PGX36960.1 alkaline serine protease [Priestia megaterium]
MLSWLVIVSSVFVIILLFYTVKYIVILLQLDSSEFTKNNQIIVKFKEDVCEETQLKIHHKHKCTILDHNKELDFQVLHSKRDINTLIKIYNKLEEVEYAEPNHMLKAFYTPNDPFFAYQYGPQKVQAPDAWDVTTSNGNIKIAIIDTGVQLNHPELAIKLWPGYNFVEGNLNPNDGNGHGTHVAGIAGALTENSLGIAGIAPSASIIPVRALDNSGNGTLSNIANAITYSTNAGAKVINLSLGSSQGSITLENAINYAWNQGVVIVAAAGNEASNTLTYPAAYQNVIAVASTDINDQKSDFSNYGTWVEVSAPGSTILSTYTGSYYAYLSGTSMACPHVAGLAALLAAQGKNNVQIKNTILSTCDPVPGTGLYWTYGRINANRAVH